MIIGPQFMATARAHKFVRLVLPHIFPRTNLRHRCVSKAKVCYLHAYKTLTYITSILRDLGKSLVGLFTHYDNFCCYGRQVGFSVGGTQERKHLLQGFTQSLKQVIN